MQPRQALGEEQGVPRDGSECRGRRSGERGEGSADHARGRGVPDDPRRVGHERVDRDGRRATSGPTVTGIQTAITLYTLVMATLMITGGKIGAILGRKRAFTIGCVIYGVRIVDDRARAEPRRADDRLVVPRRRRRGADHARRSSRWSPSNFAQGGPPAGLRPGRRRRRDRRRGSARSSAACSPPTGRGATCSSARC